MRGFPAVGIRHVVTCATVAFGAFVSFAGVARAEDAPLPPPPPPSEVEAPVMVPQAPPPPTSEEQRRVVDMAPPTVQTAPRPPVVTYPYPTYVTPAPRPMLTEFNSCAPCGPQPCFQRRDECGCALDSCGNRFGPWDVTIEGALASLSSPDGILGETLFVPGNQLNWNDVDYDAAFGGRLTISYRFECESRVELRGAYYGNPEGDARDAGFFAARPGDDGLGDISRPVNATFESEAELFSAEFNWWTELKCSGHWRWDAGLGIRYVSFDEDARVDFVTTGPGIFPVDNGFVRSEVKNRFIGMQAMFAAHADISADFEFFGSLKAMFGSIDREIDVTDLDIFAGDFHAASIDDDEFVFGLDLELGLKWRLSRCIGLGVSYNLLFLDNVQRGEDAFDFSQSNSGAVQARQAPDQLVVHSIFFGVTLNF